MGKPGAKNAGLLAAQIIGITDKNIRENLHQYRQQLKKTVLESGDSFD
ncbi:hypothetical protein [Vagococcus teuberi]